MITIHVHDTSNQSGGLGLMPIHVHFTREIICYFRLLPSDQSDALCAIPIHVHDTSNQSGRLGLIPIHVHFAREIICYFRLVCVA